MAMLADMLARFRDAEASSEGQPNPPRKHFPRPSSRDFPRTATTKDLNWEYSEGVSADPEAREGWFSVQGLMGKVHYDNRKRNSSLKLFKELSEALKHCITFLSNSGGEEIEQSDDEDPEWLSSTSPSLPRDSAEKIKGILLAKLSSADITKHAKEDWPIGVEISPAPRGAELEVHAVTGFGAAGTFRSDPTNLSTTFQLTEKTSGVVIARALISL
ncbi:hypothetical protein HDU93_009951 [Gonapodya sp. JEL0774]|nr:hypothetical protein HDU93_009951 [Gonapodya sp. JEL0774]